QPAREGAMRRPRRQRTKIVPRMARDMVSAPGFPAARAARKPNASAPADHPSSRRRESLLGVGLLLPKTGFEGGKRSRVVWVQSWFVRRERRDPGRGAGSSELGQEAERKGLPQDASTENFEVQYRPP